MLSNKPELIWQGRVQLGDEPGVYGDASYSGLTVDLPLTLEKTDPAGPDTTTLRLRTKGVETYAGYPGHLITVVLYAPLPGQPYHFQEVVLASTRMTSADHDRVDLAVNLAGQLLPARVSVRVHVDTEVPPGLYDDFVVRKLLNRSPNYVFVASLGFHA
ncbi:MULTISPECIES: hypothetical protein [unclassified Streptomyces]|uniref:hypothetical protein n=1 Tax=unclassified Streptomyces TaxID=2593676 RepID=UPI001661731E|nr:MULTISPECIES: hypothetical protein [unclassified Streptomyces]MBD0712050.1 hypothetical protein [Streptomyces sp. CBMA291]MBD0717965.1 hypothetical protein [Streptomyces sp. CBMA370]